MSSEMPSGWSSRRLGELYQERREAGRSGLPTMSVTMNDGLVSRKSLERRVESDLDPTAHALAQRGDLVYNTMRMWQGVSGVAEQDCIVSPAYVVCRPRRTIDPDFSRFFFKSPGLIKILEGHSQGLTGDRLRLYFHHFAKIGVLLPPLPEQKKIAAILSSVDTTIEATRAVIEQTRRVKEGLLQELLTKGNGRNGRPHTRFLTTEIGELPASWKVRALGDVASVRSGIAKNSKRALRQPVEVAYLRVANVQDGYLDLTDVKTIMVERSELSRYSLKAGDVLMNEGGDIDKLGRGDIWAGQIEPCVHQNHVFSVRCGSQLRPRFLTYVAQSPRGKAYFLSTGKQTTNLASINKTQLRAFPVPLPSLEEQDRIVERLDFIREEERLNGEAIRSFSTVKSGLLQELLTGRVRVRV